jgi:hypothetical protein
MTEQEAKTKWCPMKDMKLCIASDCMMWRLETEQKEGCICDLMDGEEPSKCVLDDKEYSKKDCTYALRGKTKDNCGYWKKEQQTGYCGLGGKP